MIFFSATVIAFVSAVLSGTVGLEHAKSFYDAATGRSAGIGEYITVARAFWDAAPIAAMFAVPIGLLVYGYRFPATWLRFGPALVALGAAYVASNVDPQTHLTAYLTAVQSGRRDTVGLFGVFVAVYGPAATFLAIIAGIGVGVAVAIKAREHAPMQ